VDQVKYKSILSPWPLERPRDWVATVNRPLRVWEADQIQQCTKRGRPYAEPPWQHYTAVKLHLEHTFRERGRPKKEE
jgi:hypothetical protein